MTFAAKNVAIFSKVSCWFF